MTRKEDLTVEALYQEFAPGLERIVAQRVGGTPEGVADACQTAWLRLLTHDVASAGMRGWLVIVATREAWYQAKRAPVPVAEIFESGREDAGQEFVVNLDVLLSLPSRQSRLLLMQGFGLSRTEIARQVGDSVRTVDRQLYRARKAAKRA